jgi:murein DD-endopeptidase MepM/ murein hydrolase activator NlpD
MKKRSLLLAFVLITLVSLAADKKPAKRLYSSKSANALAFPVAGKNSSIKDRWGASRGGGVRKHKGIDIHARKGTPVVAIADGIIINRDLTPIGGKTLWLRSAAQPVTAYYAHLDKQLVKEGDFVRKGQVIGTVGNTGNAIATPSHLHFGIAKGNTWVNPLPYVKNATKVSIKKTAVRKKAIVRKKVITAKTKKRR